MAREAIDVLDESRKAGVLRIAEREVTWLDTMSVALDEMPEDEDEFVAGQAALIDPSRCLVGEYAAGT